VPRAPTSSATHHPAEPDSYSVRSCTGGQQLIGIGARAIGAKLYNMLPFEPQWNGTGTETPDTAIAHADTFAGGAATATLQAVAVCANPGHNPQKAEALYTGPALATTQLAASCPAGLQVHSVAYITFYDAMVQSATTDRALQGATITLFQRGDAVPDTDYIGIDVLCAS
jgi:hypothetical protein